MTQELLKEYYQKWNAQLFGYVFRLTYDWHLSQDIVADVFVKLYRQEDMKPNRVKPWLFSVAINLVRDHKKHVVITKRHHPTIITDSARFQEKYDLEMIKAEVEKLPRRMKEIIKMFFFEELTLPEIAGITGLSYHTLKNSKLKALKKLKSIKEII